MGAFTLRIPHNGTECSVLGLSDFERTFNLKLGHVLYKRVVLIWSIPFEPSESCKDHKRVQHPVSSQDNTLARTQSDNNLMAVRDDESWEQDQGCMHTSLYLEPMDRFKLHDCVSG